MPEFKWTRRKELAAKLLAEDKKTDDEIAFRSGISRATLYIWKRNPEFSARVEDIISEFRKRVRNTSIAVVENRVAELQRRHKLMNQVIEERGLSEEMKGVPGGATGLLAHNVKGVGRGEDFQLVDLYEVDTGLLNELRQHEKQAAQELGQWTEKSDVSTGRPVPKFGKMKNDEADADSK